MHISLIYQPAQRPDTGIIWDDDQGYLKAFFPDAGGGFRMLSPSRLPEHETAYAMTIHKSQGSEFDEVLMILPNQDSPIFTRELIYTGITRAKNKVSIWAETEILSSAVVKQVRRRSGLKMMLSK